MTCTSQKIPALQRQSAVLRILPLPVVSICAKRLHTHYSGQPALLNRGYRGTTAVTGIVGAYWILDRRAVQMFYNSTNRIQPNKTCHPGLTDGDRHFVVRHNHRRAVRPFQVIRKIIDQIKEWPRANIKAKRHGSSARQGHTDTLE